jgi:hypothetical protein
MSTLHYTTIVILILYYITIGFLIIRWLLKHKCDETSSNTLDNTNKNDDNVLHEDASQYVPPVQVPSDLGQGYVDRPASE